MGYYGQNRYGHAHFATPAQVQIAALYQARHGLYLGFDQTGRIVRSDQQSAVLLLGGARSGKSNHINPWLTDGAYPYHVVSMDWKGQNGLISQLQVLQKRHVINFGPRGADVPTHRINPVSFAKATSLTLIPDMQQFAASFMPMSGSANAQFFEKRAQDFVVAVGVTLARLNGELTLPELADLMGFFATNTETWKTFEFHMSVSPDGFIRAAAEEILQNRTSDDPNAGGFGGIRSEIAKSFSCMADPQLRAAVSAPFDFDFEALTEPDCPAHIVNIMESMEFVKTSAPVIKALYTNALIHKRRVLGSMPQIWLLDEIGNIGSWPLAMELGTFGPGYGIRPVYVVQSMAQLDNLAPRASQIIPNSCGTQIYKGVRDFAEARRLSNMLGDMTLRVEDTRTNTAAQLEQQRLMNEVLFEGRDPFKAGQTLALQETLAQHQTFMKRPLMTAEEIMTMHDDFSLVFMPGTLAAPLKVRVPKYWTRKDLRGCYLGDPFHDKPGSVSIASRFWGSKKARVITESVVDELAHLPQYKDGTWSYVQGYKPQI